MFDPNTLIGYIVNGQYRLASLGGTGSYGWVYAADEVAFGEVIGQVAVKLLRPPDDDARNAVIREVQAMRQLTHPNLLGCYGAGVVSDGLARGGLYIATELASETLEARLKRPGRMAPEEVREVAEQIASALAYLCERGAVHRDVKPANILRVGNEWKLGDFGLVRGFAGTSMQASGRKGTVLYMSPEAMQGETGPFVDVWALGVVVQECLTGSLPYTGASDAELIAAALTHEPTISGDLAEPFATIVRGCLTKDRHQRWTAEKVIGFLRGASGSPPVSVSHMAQWYRKAAEQGDSAAQYSLGYCYQKGIGVTKDEKQSVEWYRKAAEQGHAEAQAALGYCYQNGIGVTKDEKQAVEWFRKAVEQGYAAAKNNLGYCYQNGIGVAKDGKQAVEWYRKAAEQGLAVAQYNLGFCYDYGIGVAQDEKQAVEWYRKAAQQGHQDARDALKRLRYR